ncbi:acetyltransferase [Campylobacter hyointestinalis subsp. hyointestinalis]|uniref:Acetyltransferase n=1 Tax=Campylobacter hyointestinalis subsp. hyointestinalis TaxID=91352 RepID=A0A9W5EYU3_CAMHY|nr:hypothetical protein [Campylobacter hyointestinalis]CUU75075.1 acetyltransferase [Campylobacter hyointestinalis subsp. hyointestinalis]CUU77723.1 acetyltransferase [Campylobacter hyointestinalis subsp. hyointestinalis]CUU77802.1 acetyltransferase [Campylobacter hyointestinalis subsp. hyointestinalis]
MKIVEIKDRNPVLIERLVNVWEDSLRKTHLFLSDLEIENVDFRIDIICHLRDFDIKTVA